MARKLLTFAETAERLRRSPAQLRWMVHNGTAPPSAKIAGRRYFDADGLDQYLDAHFEAAADKESA